MSPTPTSARSSAACASPRPTILQQIAKALQISSESLYVRAGILDPERDRRGQRGRRRPSRSLPRCPSRSRRCSACTRACGPRPAAGTSAADGRGTAGTGASDRSGMPPRRWESVDLTVRRLAMLSMHSSPLAQPGVGDSGGMNVYVRELSSALAQAGVDTTTYVRRWVRDLPDEVAVEPGFRVVHIDAGQPELPKERLFDVVGQFAAGVADHLQTSGGADLIHANYWLSGVAGHRIKHELDLPLVCTFHTLARVKAEGGDAESAWRELAEMEIIGCADAICVSCSEEERQFRRHYGDPPGPGRDRGPRGGARVLRPRRPDGCPAARSSWAGTWARADAAVRRAHPAPQGCRRRGADARRPRPAGRLAGRSSAGPAVRRRRRGGEGRCAGRRARPDRAGPLRRRPSRTTCSPATTAPPTWCSCRAARRASAWSRWRRAACGTPVVASAVGGLLTLVDHGHIGLPRARTRSRGLRQLHRRDPRQRAAGRARWRAPRRQRSAALHLVAGRRPAAPRRTAT